MLPSRFWLVLLVLLPLGVVAEEDRVYEGQLILKEGEPWFEECGSRDQWRLAKVNRGVREALRDLHLEIQPEEGELWVRLRGYLKRRLDLDRGRSHLLLAVNEVLEYGVRRCPGKPDAELGGTQWLLIRLGGREVSGGHRRHPYMILQPSLGKVQGYAGCNHFKGGFRKDNRKIRFLAIGTTRLRCETGYELESAFLKALDGARGWEVKGSLLELVDGEGRLLARFEAQQL